MKFPEGQPKQENATAKIGDVLNEKWFKGNDSGLLKLLEPSLGNETNRKILVDVLEQRTGEPVPLSQIITIPDHFNSLQKQLEGKITEKDIKWINSMIKYFEDWFYSGKWTHIPINQEDNPNTYAYFSVPAGIINFFTKIKDTPEYSNKINGFDRGKLNEFWTQVNNFEEKFMSKENLEQLLEETEIQEKERGTIENILKYRDTIRDLFKRSKGSVLREFKEYSTTERKVNSGSKAQDLYFMKTCLIAATKLMKEGNKIFMPDLTVFQGQENNYEIYDMSTGKDKTGLSKMHYHPLRLPYCKFVVKYLQQIK